MKCIKCGINDVNGTVSGDICHECQFPKLTFVPGTIEYTTHTMGWECPNCGRIYAPYVPECHTCNQDKPITGITGS